MVLRVARWACVVGFDLFVVWFAVGFQDTFFLVDWLPVSVWVGLEVTSNVVEVFGVVLRTDISKLKTPC